MKLRDAVSKIKSGKLPVTVLLHGEEEYIRVVGVRELMTAVRVSLPEINITVFEGRPSMGRLRDALAKPPLMSESKIVLLRATDILSAAAPNSLSRRLPELVLAEGTLFIIDAGEKIDRRKAAVKHILQHGLNVECQPLKGEPLISYVVQLSAMRHLHISRTAAQSLVTRCGGDLFVINTELDKLQFVCSGEVTGQDLDLYSRPMPEAGVFEIQDLLCAGHYAAAERAVRELLCRDASPMGFLSLTAAALRQMLIARACRDAGYSWQKTISTIVAETQAREWSAKRAYERSSHYSADHLRRAIARLAQIDFGAKQGIYLLEQDLYALLFEIWARPA